MQTLIDFGGFYHSVHSDNIEWRIDSEWEWEFEESGEQAAESLEKWYDKVNWKSTYNDYGVSYIDRLNNHFDLELEFVAIHSPRYYNYSTDKIVVYIPDVDEQRLMNDIEDDEFKAWADPYLTSRDGFASYYDGIDDLIKRSNDNSDDYAVLLGLIIDYLISRDSINEEIYDLEYEIIYND